MAHDENEHSIRQKTIGQFIKTRRIKAGLTQLDLAKTFGYSSPQFISNWERGVSLPPMAIFPQLASLLETSPRDFIAVVQRYQLQMLKLNERRMKETFRVSAG